MNLHKPIHINRWLIPVSWLYGCGVSLRNNFFKWGILKQKKYDIPVICVGNISMGGTGKTPHTEYLIRLLKEKYKVAVLSRGYKRKTKGFILSAIDSTSEEIGDEPYQIKQKFPDIIVAVDKKRTRGIENLLALTSPPDVIILDDGFQHRYVKPSYSIVLSDFNRPLSEDRLIPAGRLRESADYLKSATDIVVTKCPDELQPIDFRIVSRDINPFPYQGLFFSKLVYKRLKPVFNSGRIENLELDALKSKSILLVTAIASPKGILSELSKYSGNIESIEYRDHHQFTNRDLKYILSRFKKIKTEDKIIITTEKDASKLKMLKINDDVNFYFYYLPVEVAFLNSQLQEDFDKKILEHVEKNRSSSKIH